MPPQVSILETVLVLLASAALVTAVRLFVDFRNAVNHVQCVFFGDDKAFLLSSFQKPPRLPCSTPTYGFLGQFSPSNQGRCCGRE